MTKQIKHPDYQNSLQQSLRDLCTPGSHNLPSPRSFSTTIKQDPISLASKTQLPLTSEDLWNTH